MQPENNWQEAVYTVYIIYLIYILIWIDMYIYIYIQIIYMCVCIYIYIYIHIHAYICKYSIYIYLCIHMYMYTYVCISLYIYTNGWYIYNIHMCIYTYTIYIYNHTYIYRRPISQTQKPYIRIYAILDFIETLKHCVFLFSGRCCSTQTGARPMTGCSSSDQNPWLMSNKIRAYLRFFTTYLYTIIYNRLTSIYHLVI